MTLPRRLLRLYHYPANILAWAVFMPAAFIVVRSFAGGPLGAMLCLAGYMALLATAFALRFRSGAWKTIELIEPKLV